MPRAPRYTDVQADHVLGLLLEVSPLLRRLHQDAAFFDRLARLPARLIAPPASQFDNVNTINIIALTLSGGWNEG